MENYLHFPLPFTYRTVNNNGLIDRLISRPHPLCLGILMHFWLFSSVLSVFYSFSRPPLFYKSLLPILHGVALVQYSLTS